MTKGELTTIEELADMADGDNPGAASIMLQRKMELVPADIAYQLTRIADLAEKTADPVMYVDPDGTIKRVNITEPPKPAPDVAELVELISKIVQSKPPKGATYSAESRLSDIEDALAAHKPEAKSPKLCPYCQTELVVKDTYGIGGDECFDWCPECKREVDDGA